jgi:hypothetical protein
MNRRSFLKRSALAVGVVAAAPILAKIPVQQYLPDDSAMLQALIDRTPTGDTIYFPSGTYMLTRPLIIDRGGLLMGNNTTLKHVNGAMDVRGQDIGIMNFTFERMNKSPYAVKLGANHVG